MTVDQQFIKELSDLLTEIDATAVKSADYDLRLRIRQMVGRIETILRYGVTIEVEPERKEQPCAKRIVIHPSKQM